MYLKAKCFFFLTLIFSVLPKVRFNFQLESHVTQSQIYSNSWTLKNKFDNLSIPAYYHNISLENQVGLNYFFFFLNQNLFKTFHSQGEYIRINLSSKSGGTWRSVVFTATNK